MATAPWQLVLSIPAFLISMIIGEILMASGGLESAYGMTLGYAIFLLFSVLWTHYRYYGHVAALGLNLSLLSLRHLGYGAVYAGGALVILNLFAWAAGAQWIENTEPGGIATIFFMIPVLAAGEELVARGLIFAALEDISGPAVAILTTSLLFAVAHAMNPGADATAIVNTFLAGTLLGTMRWKTSSLWMPIGFHVVWNLLLVLLIGNVSGFALPGILVRDMSAVSDTLYGIFDGPFGIEHGYGTTLVLIIGIAMALRLRTFDPYVRSVHLLQRFK